MNPIAEAIRKARLRAGMTEKMLAKKCGLAENYIKQVESGRKVIQEQAAQRILQVLGEETDVLQQGSHLRRDSGENEDDRETENNRSTRNQAVKRDASLSIEPNDQWTDALAHIIRRFPVENLATGKIVAQKELPVLGKKIEGVPWERVRFFQVADGQLQSLRIFKDDLVMVCETTEIINGKIHVIEVNGQKMIRKLSKDQQKKILLSTGSSGEVPTAVTEKQLKLIGRCVSVEFRV
ncbi:helix-turn-helix domain-containing protein [Anoxynatronum sibiricum]|uniref:Helix-turn-helix domain-containing protein n=1 Tax=Anoxynatronum sibiricum TaxID=210623 RepID=A0ABU9VPU1_9CLOT